MYDVLCTIYVRFSLMYDLRVTFVLLLLCTFFVHRTFYLVHYAQLRVALKTFDDFHHRNRNTGHNKAENAEQ